MKKITKILMIIIMFFVVVVNVDGLTVNHQGLNPLPGTNGTKPTLNYYNGNQIPFVDSGYYIFETTENQPIFCLNPENTIWLGDNDPYSSIGAGNACGLIMGLKGANPSLGTITQSDLDAIKNGAKTNFNSDAYITSYKKVQNYLWVYKDYTGCDTSYSTSTTSTNTVTHEVGAISASFENNNNKLTLNSAGTYYISNKITVSKSNGIINYSVSLTGSPTGAYISTTPAGTNVGSSKLTSSTLYVNVPIGSVTNSISFSINFEAFYNRTTTTVTTNTTTITPTVTAYKYDNSHQIVGIVNYTKETPSNDKSTSTQGSVTTNLPVSLESATIKIIKKNAENQNLLEGAKFVLYNSDGSAAKKMNGTAIGTLTTNASGQITISNIAPGRYVLKETATPTGYIAQKEECTFDVTVTNGTTKITMVSTNLKNYSVSSNTISVINQPVKQTFIKKTILDSNETVLSGSHIVIKNSSGKIVQEFDSKTTANEFYLEPGTYTLEETKAPEGYKKIDTVFKFTVEKNGNITPADKTSKIFTASGNNIVLYNDALYQTFSKKTFDKKGVEQYLEGAHIIIKDSSGNIVQEFDSTDESTKFSLKAGKYTLEETVSPEGYEKIETIFEFEIDELGNVIPKDKTSKVFISNDNNIVLYNSAIYQVFSKKDIANDEELEGAHIVIKDEKGNIVLEFDSKKEPTTFYLGAGKYTLEETVSPEGYEKIETVFNFTVDKEGNVKITTDSDNIKAKDNAITLYNEMPIPDTGISTKIIYIALGSILLIGGGILIYFGVKKRKVESI